MLQSTSSPTRSSIGIGGASGASASVAPNHRVIIIDYIILANLVASSILTVISVALGRHWTRGIYTHATGLWTASSGEYNKHEYKTTRTCSVMGTLLAIISLTIAILRLKFPSIMKSKTIRMMFVTTLGASFLSILVALIVWADFMKFQIQNWKRKTSVDQIDWSTLIGANAEHSSASHAEVIYHLGWSFWVAVVAAVSLFLANLLYVMRKDCKHYYAAAANSTTLSTTATLKKLRNTVNEDGLEALNKPHTRMEAAAVLTSIQIGAGKQPHGNTLRELHDNHCSNSIVR